MPNITKLKLNKSQNMESRTRIWDLFNLRITKKNTRAAKKINSARNVRVIFYHLNH